MRSYLNLRDFAASQTFRGLLKSRQNTQGRYSRSLSLTQSLHRWWICFRDTAACQFLLIQSLPESALLKCSSSQTRITMTQLWETKHSSESIPNIPEPLFVCIILSNHILLLLWGNGLTNELSQVYFLNVVLIMMIYMRLNVLLQRIVLYRDS